eukprot:scaffold223142_cov35-Attheya_sp.AAC.2
MATVVLLGRSLSTKWDKVLWWYCFVWGKCSPRGVRSDSARVSSGRARISCYALIFRCGLAT